MVWKPHWFELMSLERRSMAPQGSTMHSCENTQNFSNISQLLDLSVSLYLDQNEPERSMSLIFYRPKKKPIDQQIISKIPFMFPIQHSKTFRYQPIPSNISNAPEQHPVSFAATACFQSWSRLLRLPWASYHTPSSESHYRTLYSYLISTYLV